VYGPYLSTIGGDQPLSPPKRHSLGRPLPYQLADITQAHPKAINLYRVKRGLSSIIPPFGRLFLTSGLVPTCYYLVCHGHITLRTMWEKYEIRRTKLETNSKHEIRNLFFACPEPNFDLVEGFLISNLEFLICFEFRYSNFGFLTSYSVWCTQPITFNLLALVRRHPLYIILRFRRELCFW
jgi:hypothetical protein